MTDSSQWNPPPGHPELPLRRLRAGRLLGGVCSGIADYLDLDVAIVRIAFVVLAFVGGVGIPAYLAGWLLIPEEDAVDSIAGDWLHAHSHQHV
jgi:phage shock protein PspC (stress-responsive transcriptional regulator)